MKLTSVTKCFDGKTVIDNLSLQIEEGKITALMGPSGCGKTTVLRLLMGFEHPDKGEVEAYTGIPAAVFQEDRLSEPLSAVQNVRLGKKGTTKEEAVRLLSALGLAGHETKAVSLLSGGMRRRVAIARALAANADTVFLDEPFSALDGDTKKEVMDTLRTALAGKTVVLVTHDESEAEAFAHTIIRL